MRGCSLSGDSSRIRPICRCCSIILNCIVKRVSSKLSFPQSFGGFPADHSCFTDRSPVIFACVTIGSYNAMAGDEEGYGVAADGGAYGAGGFGIANSFGQSSVGGQLAQGDIQERFPDLDLK